MNKFGVNQIIRIIKDFFWNIAASILTTAMLQLMVYPFLARELGASIYGQVLTIMGIANIVKVSLGGGLNNTRLIQAEKYQDHQTGDFNLLLGISNILGSLLFGIIIFINFELTAGELFVVVLYVFWGILRGYWSVAYRLKINYVANFKMNVGVALGYVIGIYLIRFTHIWAIPFFVSEALGVVYLLKTTNLYREGFRKTQLCKDTWRIWGVLVVNTLIVNIITYLDRLILYPILGGDQVSVFTISSFVGKSIGLLITPISAVLLSYYAQVTFQMSLKRFWMIHGTIIVGGIFFGILAVAFAPWVTGLLYPNLIENAMPYIMIANVAALVGVLSNIISPAVLKYVNVWWQLGIQIAYIILYFGLSMLFLKNKGLYGFCQANLLVNTARVMAFMCVGHVSIKKRMEK